MNMTIIKKSDVIENVVNKRELDIGTRIERREHGFSIAVSRKIARDHIEEYPRYYTDKRYGLIVVEKNMTKRKIHEKEEEGMW